MTQQQLDHFLSHLFFLRLWPSWITPNTVTLFRLLILGPVIFVCTWYAFYFSALIIFLLAGLLDGVDGTLARSHNITSPVGAQLDALCDKLLNVPLYIFLSLQCIVPFIGLLISIPLAFVAILLTIVRLRKRQAKSSLAGKWKMRFEVTAISLMMLGLGTHNLFRTVGTWITHIGALILLLSLVLAMASLWHHTSDDQPMDDQPVLE